jgi:hypothetical protein
VLAFFYPPVDAIENGLGAELVTYVANIEYSFLHWENTAWRYLPPPEAVFDLI